MRLRHESVSTAPGVPAREAFNLGKRFTQFLIITLCVLAAAWAAHADTLSLESGVRARLSLNGTWKMRAGDNLKWADPGLDSSAWANATVPGALPPAPSGNGSRVVWLRKTFTAPAGTEYAHLRMDRAMDQAQVWINGRKLTNPAYSKPFEDTQFGVFARIWSFPWPDAFETNGLVNPGRENLIAVRIEDHAERNTKTFQSHPDDTATGAAGILGDVYLIARPPVHISSIERVHPLSLSGQSMDTHLYLLLANETLESQALRLSLTIYADANGGHAVFDEQREITLTPGGELFDFLWKATPSFMPYRAVATVRRGAAIVDTISLRFHGLYVSVERNGLRVNGEPFAMRGVHGNPGLVRAGAHTGSNTLTWEQLDRDLDALRRAGVNTLHTNNPTPRLMTQAMERGIMVVPALTAEYFNETVFALKEHPNILFWEISTDKPNSLYVMASLIAAVDPYRRPVAYRGPIDIAPGDRVARNISMVARAARGPGAAAACAAASDQTRNTLPSYMYPWDASGAGVSRAAPAHAAAFLLSTWAACVESGPSPSGGIYTAFTTQSPALPGLRAPDGTAYDPGMKTALRETFRELEPDLYTNAAGSPVLTLRNIAGYTLRNMLIFIGSNARPAGKQSLLAAGRRFNMTPPNAGRGVVRVESTTHGGLPHSVSINTSEPFFIPDRFRFDTAPASLKPGGQARATVIIANHTGETMKCSITLKHDVNGLTLDAPGRSIIIHPGDTARAVITLHAAPGAKPAAGGVSAILAYDDTRWRPLTATLPVAIE
jgi:hypothetical protein